MTCRQLEAAGRALFGPKWKSALGHLVGRSHRQVHAWALGERSIPDGVQDKLMQALKVRREEITGALGFLKEDWSRK